MGQEEMLFVKAEVIRLVFSIAILFKKEKNHL